MVVSEIRSLYREEDDLFRTVIKRIYEAWVAHLTGVGIYIGGLGV